MNISPSRTSAEFHSLIRKDLCRLAKFGANISDSHSCFIFLPSFVFSQNNENIPRFVEIAGYHSLSNEINSGCKISCESGIIGWVAKHSRSIHVSPFEHDSRTLGVYPNDVGLKSFIGIPVPLNFFASSPLPSKGAQQLSGVIACDSKKSFAFSKLQGKLLEDLGNEVANTLKLIVQTTPSSAEDLSWHDFLLQAEEITRALGQQHVEVLRLHPTNLEQVEDAIGIGKTLEIFGQVCRLAQQSLPPHLPSYRLPQGDMVFVVDNMMTSFYENKVKAICSHVSIEGMKINFSYSRRSFKDKRTRATSIEGLLVEAKDTAIELNEVASERVRVERGFYEYRRA